MSRLLHGLYRRGFMLCDRCLWNGECEGFEPGGVCRYEREAFHRIVEALVEGYGLDGVADRLLAERAAMTLIRLARAEAYEAWRGFTEPSASWVSYVARLDRTLRDILRELAVTRKTRKELEAKSALEVDVEELLRRFVARAERRERGEARRIRLIEVEGMRGLPRPLTVYRRVLRDWLRSRG